ncbi:hypothetical protein I6I08_04280 [Actinomyces oris]|uniref:Uncharacterized protein n=1 Tax=Actinomyces oris TaxID=544580 RepID=A0A508BCC5_9ACTO|nr:DUF6037 family protein [Actinomyces oris]QQC40500.1 hypothetical protein I6I08_04280 [Actinomyces oris]TQD60350.1 hypothetical protein FK267_07850 [Actinomyces oris]
MSYLLQNLKPLRNAMRERGWVVTCFDFTYKKQGYYVTVTDYINIPKPDIYALVELCFMRKNDVSDSLSTWANVTRIHGADKKVFRDFFGIEDKPNEGNLIEQFCEQFGKWIPVDIKDLSEGQKRAVVRQLGISDTSDDPDKIYCIDVRRTGTRADGSLKERSSFNSQKSEFLRPELYAKFKDDLNLSFYYSIDPSAEKTDGQIIASVAARESTQLRRE